MVQIIIGSVAFLMFFIGDYNDWRLSNPVLKLCFPIGVILLVVATTVGYFSGSGIRNTWILIPAAIFLLLLIYTLFFAIPAKEAYVSQQNGRSVCNTGMYSMCRHPGVLWFFGLYLCLCVTGIVSLVGFITFNVLNVLLVCFEDICVFPDTMQDYAEYKQNVPFLIPGTKKNKCNMTENK